MACVVTAVAMLVASDTDPKVVGAVELFVVAAAVDVDNVEVEEDAVDDVVDGDQANIVAVEAFAVMGVDEIADATLALGATLGDAVAYVEVMALVVGYDAVEAPSLDASVADVMRDVGEDLLLTAAVALGGDSKDQIGTLSLGYRWFSFS